MTELELKNRFKAFAIRIVKMVDAMPNTTSANAIARQIVRSGNFTVGKLSGSMPWII